MTDAIRQAIFTGEYAPKQRLIEGELAQEYSISRFVVHNALLQLAGEGLVEIQQNRGARVRAISLEEAIEITDLREVVEGLVAARAAERITEDAAHGLRELAEKMRKAVLEDLDVGTYAQLADELHRRLGEISHHATALKLLKQLNAPMVREQFRMALSPGRPVSGLEQHLAIVEAICAKDAEKAEKLMREHLSQVRRTLISLNAERRVETN
ncbi:GntR family transcriptional regulator [Amycolatopsis acidicola]|uniref:GntR family transcriptional regulator n=1 Tax=Amycolatopsis acidicola TaxID=2596893 RepID=A0A5N0VGW8_9PSEU|nr:GntR family transcriptional regulator [Amycolatopsis acidicola]